MATVLIVDDEPDIRFMMRIIFERAGYVVLEASNGAAAWSVVTESLPDLVITDLMMPVVNGQNLIQRLRNTPKTEGIPIIVVSASRLSRTVGANLTIDKPFEPDRLVDAAASLVPARGTGNA